LLPHLGRRTASTLQLSRSTIALQRNIAAFWPPAFAPCRATLQQHSSITSASQHQCSIYLLRRAAPLRGRTGGAEPHHSAASSCRAAVLPHHSMAATLLIAAASMQLCLRTTASPPHCRRIAAAATLQHCGTAAA
jgi:hypothetical protein